MNKVKVLVEGYAYIGDNGNYFASPTCTLIYSNDKKVIVDPGTNDTLLLEALEKEGLDPKSIDALFLSHYHPDHFLNIKLFPHLNLIDGTMIWKKDEEIENTGLIPETDIKILPTPGHAAEHCSLIVETENGIVCIAQDVFWWEDGKQNTGSYEELINYNDPFAWNMDILKASRKKVLEIADWVIPGHGKIFKNNAKKH